MPIELAIWRLGPQPERVAMTPLQTEATLEKALVHDLSILSPGLMLVGRQILTPYGGFIDLLAIDGDGNLRLIELKRDRTPREIVAQALDYASWTQFLGYDEVAALFADRNTGQAFETAFYEAFGRNPPEEINQNHEIILVASELDSATERIIAYLVDNYNVPINAVFFRCFQVDGHEYLTRTWLIDPRKVEAMVSQAPKERKSEQWNGRDFYVSFGEDSRRNWDDARQYGFISGGGGAWYSQPLSLLFPGARVFVHIPKTGYVGVGIVKEVATPVNEFRVTQAGQELPILAAEIHAPEMGSGSDDSKLSEYLVRVEWVKTTSRDQGFWEKGMFANQLTACRLRNRFTLERLIRHFQLDD